MSAPRPLVVLALLAVIAAAVSVTILAWIAIGTMHDVNDVVDQASTSVQRLDRSARDLDPAIHSLRRAANELRSAGTTVP